MGSLARLGPALKALDNHAGAPTVRRPRRKPSPQRLAALKLQGRYMGYIRNLGPRQKARVKTVRVSHGIDAAIRLAKQLGA
jgi:hypothetical protein